MKPTQVNILGKTYVITYTDKPSDVDLFKRDSLWGQIDYWTRTIRIYDNGNQESAVFSTILHEVLHGIATELHIEVVGGKLGDSKIELNHKAIDLLSTALADVLIRNEWLDLPDRSK